MAYTQTDLDNARSAMNDIISRGVAEAEINGRKVKFLSLSDLQNMIDKIEQDLLRAEYGNSYPIAFKEATD